jgi:hypothetical protein
MEKDYEIGMNYIYGDLEQYHFIRYFGITKTSANFHKIPENWILRFCWADKKGILYLKKAEGRKICIEINPCREFEDGDRHSVFYEVIREIKELNMNGSKEVCSKLEEIVQKEIREKSRPYMK